MGAPSTSTQRLTFNKSLTKDSKLTTTELLQRLTTLLEELSRLDQDSVDLNSLSKVKDELIQPPLLVHKDKGVKALVACCLADLLRIYAPDAPYTLPELRDIFQFFFRQIRNLSSFPSHSSQAPLYLRLLESLAGVESIVLVCDVPQSEELTCEIFQLLFAVVSTEISQDFLLLFADLLTQIINATAPVIPHAVLTLLVDQFRPKQLKSNPAAYRLAVDICNACEDRLKQDVCRHFNDLLAQGVKHTALEHSEIGNSEDFSDEDDALQDRLKELEEVHTLVQNIYRPCPGLLQSVIPQLEAELQNSHNEVRLLAVNTLGELFAEVLVGSTSSVKSLTVAGTASNSSSLLAFTHQHPGNDLARRYPNTWKMWLRKASDIFLPIRAALIRWCKLILTRHPHLKHDINRVLLAKLHDSDEKVRLECCKVLGEIDFEHAMRYIDVKVLKALGGRIEDRKPSVQLEALKSLGRLYGLAYPEIESENPECVAQLAWIPQTFLSSMFVGDARLCAGVEKAFLEHVVPLGTCKGGEELWVDRLITVARYLDDINLKRLGKCARIGIKRPSGFDRYIDACKGGVVDTKEGKARLAAIIRLISTHFPDPTRVMDDLQQFAKMNDKVTINLLRTLSNEQCEIYGLIKAHDEFHRRTKTFSTSLAETLHVFLQKSAHLILNSASVPILLRRLHPDNLIDSMKEYGNLGTNLPRTVVGCARLLLDMISKGCPDMLNRHVGNLIGALLDVSSADLNHVNIESILLAVSQLARKRVSVIPNDQSLVQRISQLALHATRVPAKLAATILAVNPSWVNECQKVNNKLVDSLSQASPSRLLPALSALSCIAKHAPGIFEAQGAEVTSFIVHNLLIQSSEGTQPGDSDWIEDETLCDLSRARVEGLTVLTNRCITYASTAEAKNFSVPIFKLFWQLMEGSGRLGPVKHSVAVAARLRLKSAQSVIKLASYQAFSHEIDTHLETVAWMSQDTYYQVRERFLTKLVKYLQQRRLNNPRFNVILFLVAHDPEPGLVQLAQSSIHSRMKIMSANMRTAMFETSLVHLLHLLAHHPDFSTEIDDLKISAKHIEFFIECVANSDNVSLLYHVAGQLKTVRDSESQTHSEFLYTLSELAQLLIKIKAQEHHWTLPTYPGKIKLPIDIFRPLPTSVVAQEVLKKTYLDERFLGAFTPPKSHLYKRDPHTAVVDANSSAEHDAPKPNRAAKAVAKRAPNKFKRLKGVANSDNEAEREKAVKHSRPKRRATGKLRSRVYADHESGTETDTTHSAKEHGDEISHSRRSAWDRSRRNSARKVSIV